MYIGFDMNRSRPPVPPITPQEFRDWRTKHKITQGDAAKWLKVSLRTYQGWESNYRFKANKRKGIRLASFIRAAMRRKPLIEPDAKPSTEKTLFD